MIQSLADVFHVPTFRKRSRDIHLTKDQSRPWNKTGLRFILYIALHSKKVLVLKKLQANTS